MSLKDLLESVNDVDNAGGNEEFSLDGRQQGNGEEVYGIDLGTTYSAIAWLDQNLYRVRPEMLYAYAAYNIKPENPRTYFKWRFPKKKDDEESE